MKNLTIDQAQLILTLFQLQNAERDIEDFVPGFFHSFKYGFSKYKKIGELELVGTDLKADDYDEVFRWIFVTPFEKIKFIDGHIVGFEHFDIMKHISFEDKI